MTSPLDNLCGPGKELTHEAQDEQEYAHLIEDGLRRLTDSKNPDLYLGSRFDLAYIGFTRLRGLAVHYLPQGGIANALARFETFIAVAFRCRFTYRQITKGGGG